METRHVRLPPRRSARHHRSALLDSRRLDAPRASVPRRRERPPSYSGVARTVHGELQRTPATVGDGVPRVRSRIRRGGRQQHLRGDSVHTAVTVVVFNGWVRLRKVRVRVQGADFLHHPRNPRIAHPVARHSALLADVAHRVDQHLLGHHPAVGGQPPRHLPDAPEHAVDSGRSARIRTHGRGD